MNKLQVRGMQRHAVNQGLFRLFAVVFSVADKRMSDGRKLRPDLVLQSRLQFHADQRCAGKSAFHTVAKFSARGFRVSRRPLLLKHTFAAEVMDQRPFRIVQASAHHGLIFSYRRMCQKLPDQRIAIVIGFGEQQNAGSKPVNAMHNQRALPFRLQLRDQQRQSRRNIRAFDRHRQQPGRFVEDDDSIIFIEDLNFLRQARLPPVLAPVERVIAVPGIALIPAGRFWALALIRFSRMARFSWMFLHWIYAQTVSS